MTFPRIQTYDASRIFMLVSSSPEPWVAPEPEIPVCSKCAFPFHEDLCVHCFVDEFGLCNEGVYL
jgi:hypothetical protein